MAKVLVKGESVYEPTIYIYETYRLYLSSLSGNVKKRIEIISVLVNQL